MAMKHYTREKAIKAFWNKVDIGEINDCWNWKASCNKQGYGHVSFGGKHMQSHRVAWELTNGSIESGMFLCHKCDNPKCVNPNHMFIGTPKDNMQDMITKGRKINAAPKGEKHGMHKLTLNQVNDIRLIYASKKANQVQLAKQYGVSQRMISLIVRGENWRG